MEHQTNENWVFYFTATDNGPLSIMMNAAAGCDPSRPILGRVIVTIRRPDENGFCGKDEAHRLGEIEDALTAVVRTKLDGQFVGRTTGEGIRLFFFYLPKENEFVSTIVEGMAAFPEYRFAAEADRDETWDAYHNFLYPTEVDWEFIQNERVVHTLLENGDNLVTPREVTHWAYGPTAELRDRMKSEVIARGYAIVEELHDPNGGNRAFGVVFSSVRNVLLDEITAETLDLRELMVTLGGAYDGWETEVIRPDTSDSTQ